MISSLIDITNLKFGKLTVIGRDSSNSKSGNAKWICRCDCGNVVSVVGSKLRNSHTTSCGCNRKSEKAGGHSKERLYITWYGMHRRCYNQNHDRYRWYGAKGILVCSEWHSFSTFREWALINGYTDELTIDRINSSGNYCPENCRWVDMKFQANNRSNNRIIEIDGTSYTVSQLADEYGLSQYTVFNRLYLGWDTRRIINTPERNCHNHGTKEL